MDRPLLRHLDLGLPWCELAEYPTPVQTLPRSLVSRTASGAALYTKREDLSSPVYGGNKVRALEVLLGHAQEQGAKTIYASGASGSNHVLATALHAARLGLSCRSVVFEQPPGQAVRENGPLIRAHCQRQTRVPHWSLLAGALCLERLRSRGEPVAFTPPAGASPLGVLGHVSAALELAEQIEQGLLPAPDTVVVGLGSGGTAAGLLLGFWLATRLPLGLGKRPRILAVRVAPWPLASRGVVLGLAQRAARSLAAMTGRRDLIPPLSCLWEGMTVDGAELGRGYGYPTRSGQHALELWRDAGLCPLDLTYSAKVAAAFLRFSSAERRGTVLFWSTKSSAPLPPSGGFSKTQFSP